MNKYNGWLLAFALVAGSVQGAETAAPQLMGESVITMRVDGELTIGTEGQVLSYTIRSKVDPSVQAVLEKAIPSWRLQPVFLNGKPANAKTPMRITLVGRQVATGYEVQIDNVIFAPLTKADKQAAEAYQAAAKARGDVVGSSAGGVADEAIPVSIKSRKMTPPFYPLGLMRAGVGGIVLLRLQLDHDGNVTEAMATQSALFDVKAKPELLMKAAAVLEKNAITAAKRWKFSVVINHSGALTSSDFAVRVPVTYYPRNDTSPDAAVAVAGWRYEFRTPQKFARVTDDEQFVGVSDLENGETLSGRSAFRFAEKGSAL